MLTEGAGATTPTRGPPGGPCESLASSAVGGPSGATREGAAFTGAGGRAFVGGAVRCG